MRRNSVPVYNSFLAPVLDRAESFADLPFAEIWATNSRVALTYAELSARARLFARLFLEAGSQGGIVFIILKHCADLYCSFLGAMLAGMVPSFLPFPSAKQDHRLYWETHRAVFARTRPAAILFIPNSNTRLRAPASGYRCE
jgi:fatty-acyl-CoA synthase